MDIPTKKYLVYRAAKDPQQSEWVSARIGQPERITPRSSIVVYRAKQTDPFFCDGLGHILGMVHEEMTRGLDDQAPSLSEEGHGRDPDNVIIVRVPSSQESIDGML